MLIGLYQKTSFLRTRRCRFYPSCSQYAKLSIQKHGVIKGLTLASIRLCKCNPFHNGGVDEVPENFFFATLNYKKLEN